MNTFPGDASLPPESPRVLVLYRRLIVALGVPRSVLALTIAVVGLSLSLAVLIRAATGASPDPARLLPAALIPILIVPPLSWLSIGLIARLDRSERAQQHLATHDSLTELCNRREFFQRMARVHERARRDARPAWLLMLDMDRFKQINDEFGHLAGDRAIRQVADLCRAETRPGDVLGRYGGDEFALLIVGLDRGAAGSLAARLRERIVGTPLHLPDGRSLTLSASIGLAPLACPGAIDPACLTLDKAIGRADDALRQAKRLGRDRICVAEPRGCETLAA